MSRKGFIVPPGGGSVLSMAPGRSAALKLVGGETETASCCSRRLRPPGLRQRSICTGTATRSHGDRGRATASGDPVGAQ